MAKIPVEQQKRDIVWWYGQYMKYCRKNNIDDIKQSYKEYHETMQKVFDWVEKNGVLS